MEAEEIKVSNHTIALFMGYSWEPNSRLNGIKGMYTHPTKMSMQPDINIPFHPEYHSSFDWQVPVWSKIAHLTQGVASDNEVNTKQHLRFADMYESSIFTNDTNKGFETIVEAILWYQSLSPNINK